MTRSREERATCVASPRTRINLAAWPREVALSGFPRPLGMRNPHSHAYFGTSRTCFVRRRGPRDHLRNDRPTGYPTATAHPRSPLGVGWAIDALESPLVVHPGERDLADEESWLENLFQDGRHDRLLVANHRDAAVSSVGAMPLGITPSLCPCLAGFSRQADRGPFRHRFLRGAEDGAQAPHALGDLRQGDTRVGQAQRVLSARRDAG